MACVLHVRAYADGGASFQPESFHTHWEHIGLFLAAEEAMCLYLAQVGTRKPENLLLSPAWRPERH